LSERKGKKPKTLKELIQQLEAMEKKAKVNADREGRTFEHSPDYYDGKADGLFSAKFLLEDSVEGLVAELKKVAYSFPLREDSHGSDFEIYRTTDIDKFKRRFEKVLARLGVKENKKP